MSEQSLSKVRKVLISFIANVASIISAIALGFFIPNFSIANNRELIVVLLLISIVVVSITQVFESKGSISSSFMAIISSTIEILTQLLKIQIQLLLRIFRIIFYPLEIFIKTVFRVNVEIINRTINRTSDSIDVVLNDITSNSKRRVIKNKYPNLSIVGIMRERRSKQTVYSILMNLISILGYYFFSKVLNYQIDQLIVNLFFVFIILLAIQKFAFEYRIYSGLYGNNEREAREIMSFIIKEADDIDFSDHGKHKKIISKDDLEEIRSILMPNFNKG